ncbi:MAG: sugar kinase, partial [Chloroflexota bacterium]|nr:sugar kinase [Chloroflexota bacterium]
MPVHLLGVDVGTQGSKGVLVTTDGRVVACVAVEHDVERRFSGWAEHDADAVWWGDFVRITKTLLDRSAIAPASIAAIGVSALTPNMLPLDATGRPLRPAILYDDTRAYAELAWLRRELGWDRSMTARSPKFSSHSVPPKILWYREHEPERWERTHKI